jgi:hypothetical protein
MVAPPGLPACWLEKEPCEFHTHFSQEQAETPHTHYYLIDLTLGTAAQPVPFVHFESELLVVFLSLSGVKFWQKKDSQSLRRISWAYAPEPPPPRLTLPSRFIYGFQSCPAYC